MTPLSRVITSFHPIERHSIHPLSADTNSARQAGQRVWLDGGTGGRPGGWGRWGEMKKEGWTVWRQGNEEKRRGRWWAWVGEERGVDNSDAHHSQVCVQTLVRFWKKKRVALQRPSPPASHPHPPHPPTSMPLFLGHLWARGVGSGGIETACTLTYCHIQLQSKLRATALKEIFLPSFFQIWNQRGRPFDSCKGSPSLPF